MINRIINSCQAAAVVKTGRGYRRLYLYFERNSKLNPKTSSIPSAIQTMSMMDKWMDGLRPMTHAPETGAINRRQTSGADFWRVCHAKPVPILSGTRFRRRLERCSIPSRFLAWNGDMWLVTGLVYLFVCCWARPDQAYSCKLIKHTLRCQSQNICHTTHYYYWRSHIYVTYT